METVNNTETLTFEQAMEQLELVVRKLDNGELPLEDAITSFQDGLEYIKVCQEKLNKAEGKLAMFRDGRFEIQ
ncbi:MAG: exodeoxyribonuclease VII small subunit [Peptococcaceae bacterium]|nr:exodeoxyribonuclease VII small subunit [Peptococcaceae bacterium]